MNRVWAFLWEWCAWHWSIGCLRLWNLVPSILLNFLFSLSLISPDAVVTMALYQSSPFVYACIFRTRICTSLNFVPGWQGVNTIRHLCKLTTLNAVNYSNLRFLFLSFNSLSLSSLLFSFSLSLSLSLSFYICIYLRVEEGLARTAQSIFILPPSAGSVRQMEHPRREKWMNKIHR